MRKEAGVETWGPAFRWALHPDQITFGEVFQTAGYKTGYLEKWHCGWDESQWPDKQGFEFAEGYRPSPALTKGHWGKSFLPPQGAELPGLTEDEYMSEALSRRAEDFITAQRKNPFLLVVSHYLVHGPLDPDPDKMPAWKDVPTTDQDNPKMAAMIESVDDSVGRIVASLKKNGVWENTVLIFTSDNGGYKGVTSTYPLLGTKATIYEGGSRVPLIMTWPGHIPAGQTDDAPTMNIDLYPTLLDLTGVAPDPQQHLDGVSLKPILTEGKSITHRPLYFHFPHYSGEGCSPASAIRYKGLKLYRYYNVSPRRLHHPRSGGLLLRLAADRPEIRDHRPEDERVGEPGSGAHLFPDAGNGLGRAEVFGMGF
jgi:arylsulfatase A